MRVFVTGAGGFIGRALCARLLCEHEVVAGLREESEASALPPDVKYIIIGHIGPETDWRGFLQGAEVVVHLAARCHILRETAPDPLAEFRLVNVAGTQRLAEACAPSGVRRLVFMSSVGVLGDSSGDTPFTETSAPQPHDAYSLSKWEAEQALAGVAARTGLEVAIIRPPLVYGPGVGGNFVELLRWVKRGVPLPLASARNRRSLIGLDNLVDFVTLCVRHPRSVGQIFLVSDGEDISTPELFRRLARAMGRPARIFAFPVPVLRALARAARREKTVDRLFNSLVVCSDKARQMLGWAPPVPMDEGLARTAKWFQG